MTETLSRIDARYRLFERLKSGPGRTTGYRMTDAHELDRLEKAGLLVWANARYGARYAIDQPGLDDLLAADLIPVIHAGQPEVIPAVRAATPNVEWTVIQLECDAETARSRIVARDTGDVDLRLAARDATPWIDADLTINTSSAEPGEVAQTIDALRTG
ncbi:kinase [Nocardia salmonicida]|uniref:kinase n=1 Tax=Nocardia salmonicida TaxID=53431 RepID=UPI00379D954A